MSALRTTLSRPLAWLAPALVLGIVAMHSMVSFETGSPQASMTSMSASHDHAAMTSADVPADSPSGDHGGPMGGMVDCSGLMTMCLAVLLAIGAMLLVGLRATRRVLTRLPRSGLARLGHARDAFQSLTPLQRTAIIRC